MHSDPRTAIVIHSPSFDPCYNLAVEEYLFSKLTDGKQGHRPLASHPTVCGELIQRGLPITHRGNPLSSGLTGHEVILYLWQNEKTVVIGKNQNAWKECNWTKLEAEGGQLARRLSGGGAVYHDLGNLNYTFISPQQADAEIHLITMIQEAVQSCGIEASFTGRNDLCAKGKKFSGMASYQEGPRLLQHGTLLVNTDLALMARYLTVSSAKIRSKGVDSVQARVINLARINPNLSVDQLRQALESRFRFHYGDFARLTPDALPVDTLSAMYHKYASWEWRFGTSPDFDLELEHTFPWGSIDLCLKLKGGLIDHAILYSDAMDPQFIETIARTMTAVQLEPQALASALYPLIQDSQQMQIIKDILAFF